MRLGLLLTGLLLSLPTWSIEPELTLQQLNHRSWTAASGAPSYIQAMTQTADGMLWLGGPTGLFRFDGVRFERYTQPPGQQPLPSTNIYTLGSWPDTGLWIGFLFGGVAVLNDNRLISYGEHDGLPAGSVKNIVRGLDGEMWVASNGGLAHLRGNRWERVSIRPDVDSEGTLGAYVDGTGTMWVLTARHLFARPRGANAFQEMRSFSATATRTQKMPLAMAPDGTLWTSAVPEGLLRVSPPSDPNPSAELLFPRLSQGSLLFDRDGNLWVAGQGIQRLSARVLSADASDSGEGLETFTGSDGLSGRAHALFQDHEDNIWVATMGGLDQFSRSNLVKVAIPPGATSPALAADEAGAVWAAYARGPARGEVARIVGNTLSPPLYSGWFTCVYRDPDGSIWFGGTQGLIHLEGTRRTAIPLPEQARLREVQAMGRDSEGGLWISAVGIGVFRLAGGQWTAYGNLPGLPRATAIVITTDATGAVWFGYTNNRIARVAGSSVKVLQTSDGLTVGNITAIQVRDSHVWIGGEFGLAHFDGTHISTLLGPTNDALKGLSGIIATANGDLWLNGNSGISHISRTQWVRGLQDPTYRVHLESFSYLDGLPGTATQLRPTPSALEGSDGRLWFTHLSGIVSIDPARVRHNALPPPVSIWSVSSGGRLYDTRHLAAPVRLPERTRTLQIQFSAGSLSVPERVRFRYKLEGSDEDWQDAGNRREAFYTNLSPGHYTFRVVAANNDGVWNNIGASIGLIIAPTFYQTGWFDALCVLVCLAVLYALHRLRLKQARAQVRARLEERVTERARIAREIHDTLLQSIQGLILRFHAIAERITPRESVHEQMERAILRAEEVLAEGRDRVKDLRASGEIIELSQALAAKGQQLAQEHAVHFRTSVEGMHRDLHPIVREEALLIAGEALTNAFRHARASNVEVELSFGFNELHVRIRDDGNGIDPAFLHTGGRPGHWGLTGMRERARKIRAVLNIWSKPDAGTEIDLCVPADVAYTRRQRESRSRWRLWFTGIEH